MGNILVLIFASLVGLSFLFLLWAFIHFKIKYTLAKTDIEELENVVKILQAQLRGRVVNYDAAKQLHEKHASENSNRA